MPKISVILPVYNASFYIATAIKSILKQTFGDFELIIINDGSTDETQLILNKSRDKRIKILINKKSRGVAGALNQALKLANGTYIARMDADDISKPQRLEEQIKFLERNLQYAGVGSWIQTINADGKLLKVVRYPSDYRFIKKRMLVANFFAHPAMMLRKKVIDEIGGYDEKLNGAEDYDLFIRICAVYQMTNIPHVLLLHRLFNRQVTHKHMKHTELQALKARLKALISGKYPPRQVVYCLPAMFSYGVPLWVKKLFFYKYE